MAELGAICLLSDREDGVPTVVATSGWECLLERRGLGAHRLIEWLFQGGSAGLLAWDTTRLLDLLVWDVPRARLIELAESGCTTWRGATISAVPGHFIELRLGRRTRRITDLKAFFGGFGEDLDSVLRRAGISLPGPRVALEPSRPELASLAEPDLQALAQARCELIAELGGLLRGRLWQLGLHPHQLTGFGALAGEILARSGRTRGPRSAGRARSHPELKALSGLKDLPERLFFGGRQEACGWGHLRGDLVVADINSAYGWALTQLPDMGSPRDGWRWQRSQPPARLEDCEPWGIYLASWSGEDIWGWHPLPLRRGDVIVFPCEARGWYYGVELASACGFSGKLTIERALVPEGAGPHHLGPGPLAEPIGELLALRSKAASQGGPRDPLSQWLIKGLVNSVWGTLCQRQGSGSKPPQWRDLLLAGMTTALIRSRINSVLAASPEQVYCVAVDSVICRPGIVDLGSLPGQWRITASSHKGGTIISEGISVVGRSVRSSGYRVDELGSIESIRKAFEGVNGSRMEAGESEDFPSDHRWAWYVACRRYVSLQQAAISGRWDDWRKAEISARCGLEPGNLYGQHWPEPKLRHPAGGLRRAAMPESGIRPDPPAHREGGLWHPLFAVPQADQDDLSQSILSQAF